MYMGFNNKKIGWKFKLHLTFCDMFFFRIRMTQNQLVWNINYILDNIKLVSIRKNIIFYKTNTSLARADPVSLQKYMQYLYFLLVFSVQKNKFNPIYILTYEVINKKSIVRTNNRPEYSRCVTRLPTLAELLCAGLFHLLQNKKKNNSVNHRQSQSKGHCQWIAGISEKSWLFLPV